LLKKNYAFIFFILGHLSTAGFAADLSLKSQAFAPNSQIPSQYTCQGDDVSPALVWQNSPTNTRSFVLIVDDPDATNGTWTHWILFNIPAVVQSLPESSKSPVGAISGRNSWGKTGYGGPCPPSGTHRYFFRLYALDTLLSLNASATVQDVTKAMQKHILANTELMGLYKKQ